MEEVLKRQCVEVFAPTLPSSLWLMLAWLCDDPVDASNLLSTCKTARHVKLKNATLSRALSDIRRTFSRIQSYNSSPEVLQYLRQPWDCAVHERIIATLFFWSPDGLYETSCPSFVDNVITYTGAINYDSPCVKALMKDAWPWLDSNIMPQTWIASFVARIRIHPIGLLVTDDIFKAPCNEHVRIALCERYPALLLSIKRRERTYELCMAAARGGGYGVDHMDLVPYVLSSTDRIDVHWTVFQKNPEYVTDVSKDDYEYNKIIKTALASNIETFRHLKQSDKICKWAIKADPLGAMAIIREATPYAIRYALYQHSKRKPVHLDWINRFREELPLWTFGKTDSLERETMHLIKNNKSIKPHAFSFPSDDIKRRETVTIEEEDDDDEEEEEEDSE